MAKNDMIRDLEKELYNIKRKLNDEKNKRQRKILKDILESTRYSLKTLKSKYDYNEDLSREPEIFEVF